MNRLLVACLATLVALGVLLPAGAVGSQESEMTIRIVAQRLDDGRVEFGIQQLHPDGTWGDRVLPRARKFPYASADVGRWLHSSPLDLASTGTIRATPTTTTTARDSSGGMFRVDSYWSQDGDTFYLVIGGISPNHSYCEVHLTLDGRRTGEWTNELPNGRTQVTFDFFMPVSIGARVDFDGYEILCS